MAEEQSEFENEQELELLEMGEDGMGVYSRSEPTIGMEEEGEEEEEMFSKLGDSSDDPEQQRRYMEYIELIKEIDAQNETVETIKGQIIEMCAKECKTRCEIREIKRMRECMEAENLKLRQMMQRAMNLQNFGSHRRYLDLPIATTIDEENMSPYVGTIPPQITSWRGGREESSDADQQSPCMPPCSQMDPDADEDLEMRKLCQALCKLKPRCPEDKKAIQEIAAALMCSKRLSQGPCPHKQPPQQRPCPPKSKSRPCPAASDDDSIDQLKQKITCMQGSVNRLKKEICKRERERAMPCPPPPRPRPCPPRSKPCPVCPEPEPCYEEADPVIQCLSKRKTQKDKMEKLKENYIHLLSEYAKKDCQMKELEQRLKGFCGGCGGANGKSEQKDANEAELQLLRVRCNEMKEEQVEFKCIMKEQAHQLEDYRNKYLTAQQKVEEQSVTLDKLNMTNKRIEKQINNEVKEIRAKFQEKLNELTHFPKLLENEQLKLAQACKEKDELQSKLMLVCKELKSLKAQLEQPKENTDCRPQLAKCQLELSQTKQRLEEMERQRDMFCEQLKSTQEDLDMLRSESAKIIARTKERTEVMKVQMQEQIDRLEKELAQCRATACLSVSDREAVIREMQGQLNTLSYSFDAAQKQIKTLRNHIAYVSNENCFPVKC